MVACRGLWQDPAHPAISVRRLGRAFVFLPRSQAFICLLCDLSKKGLLFLSHKSIIQMLRTVPAFSTQLTFPCTKSNCDFNGYVKM